MSMTEETVLDKVLKLLAKAEDQAATPEEAQSYVEMAQKLMAKYQVDEALLDAKRGARKEVVVDPISKFISVPNPFRNSKAMLAASVARQNGCKCVFHSAGYGERGYVGVTVVGMPRDVEWVEVLFTSLILQLTQELITTPVTGEYTDWDTGARKRVHGKTFRKNFIEGFTSTVEGRLQKARTEAEAEAPDPRTQTTSSSVALALMDKRERVRAAYNVFFPPKTLGKASYSSSTRNSSGYSQGSAAGQRANISNNGLGQQGRLGR